MRKANGKEKTLCEMLELMKKRNNSIRTWVEIFQKQGKCLPRHLQSRIPKQWEEKVEMFVILSAILCSPQSSIRYLDDLLAGKRVPFLPP